MDKLLDEATLRLRGGVSVAWGQCEIICQWVVDPLAAEKGAHGLNGRITLNVKKARWEIDEFQKYDNTS